jgi:Trk-type K+ transport system membrane component
MNNWSMDTWLLIIGGIGFVILIYEILSGKTFSNRSDESYTRSYSREIEPGKFWLSIVIQFIVLVGLILVFKFVV